MWEGEIPSDYSASRAYASLTRTHHISHFVPVTIPFSHFERQRRLSYRQGIQLSSAFALVVRHGPALWGLIAWYTTCIHTDMPRSSLVSRNSRIAIFTSRWSITASIHQAIGSRSYASLAGKFVSARSHMGWQRREFCSVLRACYRSGIVLIRHCGC